MPGVGTASLTDGITLVWATPTLVTDATDYYVLQLL